MIALNLIRIYVRIILREWSSSSMIWCSQSSKCCSVSVLAVALVSALLTHDRVEVDEAWSPTYCSELHWQSPVSAQSSVLSEFTPHVLPSEIHSDPCADWGHLTASPEWSQLRVLCCANSLTTLVSSGIRFKSHADCIRFATHARWSSLWCWVRPAQTIISIFKYYI